MHYLKLSLIIPVLVALISLDFINQPLNPEIKLCSGVQKNESEQIVNFAISHGHCNLGFTGTTEYVNVKNSQGDPKSLKLDFSINTSTINTFDNGGPLTQSLHEKEMFNGNGKNYITFKTIDVFMLGENWIQFRGTLTIKGIEKTLRLRATPNFNGDQLNSLVVDGVVDLADYGIGLEVEDDDIVGREMFLNMVVTGLSNQIN